MLIEAALQKTITDYLRSLMMSRDTAFDTPCATSQVVVHIPLANLLILGSSLA